MDVYVVVYPKGVIVVAIVIVILVLIGAEKKIILSIMLRFPFLTKNQM